MSIAYDYDRETTLSVAASGPKLLLIDELPSASSAPFETLNPATEQVIATISEGNEADSIGRSPPRAAPSKVPGAGCAPPSAATSCSGWSN